MIIQITGLLVRRNHTTPVYAITLRVSNMGWTSLDHSGYDVTANNE
jgi:hypothetical protein